MDYIYDIVLNFQNEYYDFYEWHSSDKIINVKKVPIYKINNQDYLNIKNNDTIIDITSLPKKSKIFLLTNGVEVMGVFIDKTGNVIKKSSLIFSESDDILMDKDKIRRHHIKYNIKNKKTINYQSRIATQKKEYINKYFNSIDKKKDEYILKYLYYDIYNKKEKNIDIIYDKLIKLSNDNLNKMYESVKKIEFELKK